MWRWQVKGLQLLHHQLAVPAPPCQNHQRPRCLTPLCIDCLLPPLHPLCVDFFFHLFFLFLLTAKCLLQQGNQLETRRCLSSVSKNIFTYFIWSLIAFVLSVFVLNCSGSLSTPCACFAGSTMCLDYVISRFSFCLKLLLLSPFSASFG